MHIDVQDNGPGFSPDALKRATEPFFTTRTVGLGLGLTVARKIVEMHSGSLNIIPPKEDQPSLVRITLPLSTATDLKSSVSYG
jgi:nitrogen fixation/metabolism regulation signal transduction histidine kinase